jgi:RNA polymerase sigma factor (sigma-70 family)
VVRNRAIDRLRDLRRVRPLAPSDLAQRLDSAEGYLDSGEDGPLALHEPLLRLVKRLPEHQRSVVILRFLGGLDHSAIASALSRSEGSVRTALSRALSSLRQQLEAN